MHRFFTLTFVFLGISAFSQIKTGVATHFEALGKPFGGCGVPQDKLETPHFVALNVFDTPGQPTDYTRPLSGADLAHIGEFNNGNNCGRWLKVTILENCNGLNDGQLGQTFCRGANASWINDSYSGAELNMLVADACGDPNGWCRDSPYHLDLATASVNQFVKDGARVGDMLPTHFNNRKIQWEYIEAPDYRGDIRIFLMQGAQKYWTPVLINHLPNGIHALEQKVNGKWVAASRYNDMGQAFLLPDNNAPYTIRIKDANDQYVQKGREYTFGFPATCGAACAEPATEVPYKTNAVLTSLEEQGEVALPQLYAVANGPEAKVLWNNMPAGRQLVKVMDMTGVEHLLGTTSTGKPTGILILNHLPAGYYKVLFYSDDALIKIATVVIPR